MNDTELPMKGYCFVINKDCDNSTIKHTSKDIEKFVNFCCINTIPHNVLFTYGGTEHNEIRIFFYVRTAKHLKVHEFHADFMIIGFPEFSGYFYIATEDLYNSITEKILIENLQQQIENVCDDIESDIVKLYS